MILHCQHPGTQGVCPVRCLSSMSGNNIHQPCIRPAFQGLHKFFFYVLFIKGKRLLLRSCSVFFNCNRSRSTCTPCSSDFAQDTGKGDSLHGPYQLTFEISNALHYLQQRSTESRKLHSFALDFLPDPQRCCALNVFWNFDP